MGNQKNAAALTSLSGALLVSGLLLLDSTAWYIQYPVLGAAVLVSVVAFFQALDADSAGDSQPSQE